MGSSSKNYSFITLSHDFFADQSEPEKSSIFIENRKADLLCYPRVQFGSHRVILNSSPSFSRGFLGEIVLV